MHTHTHTHAVYLLGNECIQHNIQVKACLKSQKLHPVWEFFSSLPIPTSRFPSHSVGVGLSTTPMLTAHRKQS